MESELNELKEDVLDAVRQLRDNFETHIEEISRHSLDYLKPHDKVLIWGYSELIASFIESAVDSKSRKTPITLLISGPSKEALHYQSRMEKHLARKLLQIIIIGDGAFFSVMPIVQKVLIPVSSLLPDGSLRAQGGTRSICLAARAHSVPGMDGNRLFNFIDVLILNVTCFSIYLSPSISSFGFMSNA